MSRVFDRVSKITYYTLQLTSFIFPAYSLVGTVSWFIFHFYSNMVYLHLMWKSWKRQDTALLNQLLLHQRKIFLPLKVSCSLSIKLIAVLNLRLFYFVNWIHLDILSFLCLYLTYSTESSIPCFIPFKNKKSEVMLMILMKSPVFLTFKYRCDACSLNSFKLFFFAEFCDSCVYLHFMFPFKT